MTVIYQTFRNTGKLYLRNSIHSNFLCKCRPARKYSDSVRKFITFDEVIAQRRAEARRSLVVQVQSQASFNELYGYCTKYADINGVHHYNNTAGDHFMLIEFSTEDNAKEVLRDCSAHHSVADVMSIQSPFLWFRANNEKKTLVPDQSVSLTTIDGNMETNEDSLLEQLAACESISDQIQLLYDLTVLNDVGVRLRYMVARQLEVIFSSLYSNIAIRPFGSSVNGFGRMGCDLDLVLTNVLTDKMSDPSKRLVYQGKKSEYSRVSSRRHMEVVSELLELSVPGVTKVLKILNARVPIVKYTHDFTDVQCDLSYYNTSGVYMSEYLWLMGSLDPRVRPLAFVIRRWAHNAGLTSPQHPGRWITNFPLTVMVLFFLQQKTKNGPILPPMKYMVGMAGTEDIRLAEDNLNCTFLRDLNKLPTNTYSQNTADLETLLLEFFEFYAQFDFSKNAISLLEGAAVRKPSDQPLYIVNPLEQVLNVSRNVSHDECEKIKLEVRNAAWHLEAAESKRSEDWGILSLIEKRSTRGLKKLLRVGQAHRLVSVKDLFKPDPANEKTNDFRSKINKLSAKTDGEVESNVREMKESMVKQSSEERKFKNNSVANAVRQIRRNKMH